MWIKLHKKLLNWEWYSDINVTRLFIHLLLKANYEDKEWQGIIIERGSLVTSLSKLCKETGLTMQQTRTAIDKLILTDNITNKSYTKYRLITIKNYNEYQTNNKQNNKQITNKQQTEQQQLKNIELKNIDNIYYYLETTFGRTLAPVEYETISRWQEWFSDDIIKYAIDITIKNGARALSYTEAIINAWHDKGYKNLEQCQNERQLSKKETKLSEEKQNLINKVADWDWLED